MKMKTTTIILVLTGFLLLGAFLVHYFSKRFITFARALTRINHRIKAIIDLDTLLNALFGILIVLFILAVILFVVKKRYQSGQNIALSLIEAGIILSFHCYRSTQNAMLIKAFYVVPIILFFAGLLLALYLIIGNVRSGKNSPAVAPSSKYSNKSNS